MYETSCMYWYNFVKEEYEYIETPEDFSEYIPQLPSAKNLYELYQKIGDDPIVAAAKVLRICAETR